MLRKVAFCGAFPALLLASTARAHHPSAVSSTGGAGPINTISATTLEQGQSSLSILFEMVKIGPFSDAQLASFAGQHIHVHSLDAILAPSLAYSYGVTKDFTVAVRLPYLIRQDIREGSHHHEGSAAINAVVNRGNADGIGDLSLLGQYRFFNDWATQTEAALLLGVKAPTGRTGLKDRDGEVFETEFQPGTGSWDGLLGLALTKRVGPWSFDASVLYVLATEGAQATDMGDRFQYNVAVSYRLTGQSSGSSMRLGAMAEPMHHGGPGVHHHDEPPAAAGMALDLVLELNGEWHDKQEIAGINDPTCRTARQRKDDQEDRRLHHSDLDAGAAFTDAERSIEPAHRLEKARRRGQDRRRQLRQGGHRDRLLQARELRAGRAHRARTQRRVLGQEARLAEG